jgi:2-oxoglutarate ferredoxin oxidoreductase subunit beta
MKSKGNEMSTDIATATSAATKTPKLNRIGLDISPYRGGKTTLCAGCGHNAITERIIDAFYEMGVDPQQVVKFSGIGCSSKSPAYFLEAAHGFNAVHGRMPAVATGAMMANRSLLGIGVSGDGDTVSIGIGQFMHMMRRNLPMIYIIEDNGCYGLTKGQFSATADIGSKLKTGVVNDLPAVDTCALAIELGATFVARSFSGDKKQLSAILKAAISHRGTAMIDVISPCVTFNDHEGSTKSYSYVKDHEEVLSDVSFVPFFEDITVDYDPGTTKEVEMHDGSRVLLHKLPADYDPSNSIHAVRLLGESHKRGELLTGIFYVNPEGKDFIELLNLIEAPLATLSMERVRPERRVLDELMEELK